MATKKKTSHSSTAKKKTRKRAPKESPQAKNKVHKVMHEYKEGALHIRNKRGPVVKSRKQAIAIALSEAGVSRSKPKRTAKR